MSKELTDDHPHHEPAFSDALIFRTKATLLQMNRAARSILRNETTRFPIRDGLSGEAIIGQSVTRLWTGSDDSEKYLLAGKVHNLRLAIRRLDGVEIPAGGAFSFWSQIGRPGGWRGYVAGRELREGCIIATVGGGLCQLSNALYDAALDAGLEIVERHAHSRVIAGSLTEREDRDMLLLPLDGARLGMAAYAWRTSGFADVHESPLFTAMRSIASRR